MMENMRVLTFTGLGETQEENDRVTLSPMEIQMSVARDDVRQGLPCKKMSVVFKDGACVELYVSDYDLLTVEQAIGMYGFME